MNLIETFQDLIAQVPEFLQPLVVALAAAIPFIEGEGAAGIGVLGGINPVVAAIAAIIGNFACVAVLVLASSSARRAIVARRKNRAYALSTADGSDTLASTEAEEYSLSDTAGSPRKEKFQRALIRYGVPGVSLLGPLLLPTHFTATMLAAAGVGKTRILLWQAIAIIGWTTVFTVIASGVVYAVS